MNRLFAPLDIYCERLDAGFWSEPVNALTNVLIVAAGLFGFAQVQRRETGLYAAILCWWVVVIGLGSLLFHTTAIELTKWADILPIATFTLALAAGATPAEAARLANYAGGVVVMKHATATVSADELLAAVRGDASR